MNNWATDYWASDNWAKLTIGPQTIGPNSQLGHRQLGQTLYWATPNWAMDNWATDNWAKKNWAMLVCLFVCVGPGNSSDGSPIFQGVSSSPRGGVGTSLPGLTGGIPTRAWVGNKHS